MTTDSTADFECYVRSATPGLVRFATVITGDGHLAQDVVQEVLIRAGRQWSRVSRAGSPEAYVRRMVVNEYLSWRRRWARQVPRAEVQTGQTAADHADRHAERDALDRRLQQLPPRQRAVLVLRYYAGLPDEEIGRQLDCSAGTVRSHASRALAALRIDDSHTLLREEPSHADHR